MCDIGRGCRVYSSVVISIIVPVNMSSIFEISVSVESTVIRHIGDERKTVPPIYIRCTMTNPNDGKFEATSPRHSGLRQCVTYQILGPNTRNIFMILQGFSI